MSNRLINKVVLITGSSRGLGKIIAGRFLEEGSKVVITGRDMNELDRAEEELKQAGNDNILKNAVDIRNEDEVQALVKSAVEHFGGIDILINNAGVFKAGEVDQFSLDDFNLTFDVNVKGAFLVTKHVVAQMKKQKSGQIINICSIGSKLGLEKLSAYCASKAALALFGDSLKAELHPDPLRGTTVFPHAINSQKDEIDPDSDKRKQMIEPEDIADALIMVTSSKEYVQYQDITIYPYSTKIIKTEK
jgi:NADP-dependent 3-hydroxy acid dehydrogenase YdfG